MVKLLLLLGGDVLVGVDMAPAGIEVVAVVVPFALCSTLSLLSTPVYTTLVGVLGS